jgi:lactoylglutathione lyase
MSQEVRFTHVGPIGDTDVMALPVKEIGPAIGFYGQVLGFKIESKEEKTAVMRRDDVTIGLAANDDDPEQASCYFGVTDVETLREELDAMGIEPSAMRVDTHDGEKFRVFFAKEPYGVCFCFGQKASEG